MHLSFEILEVLLAPPFDGLQAFFPEFVVLGVYFMFFRQNFVRQFGLLLLVGDLAIMRTYNLIRILLQSIQFLTLHL